MRSRMIDRNNSY